MPNQQTFDDIDGELLMARLTPEAVSRTWPDLKASIEIGLPPLSNPTQRLNRMTDILESLLTSRMAAHVFYKMEGNQPYVFGTVVTAILKNVENDQKNLLIYSVYGHAKYVTGDYSDKFFTKMKELARGLGCEAIVAYSMIPAVIESVKRLGGNADYRLLTLEVGNE